MQHSLFAILLASLFMVSCAGTKEFIASTHPNGKPESVLYMKGKGAESEKVKEKVYYPNGQLEYVGHFKNGVEHGEWIYYYEDGTLKFKQEWSNGVESGVHYDYAPDGQIYREIHYKDGKVIKEIDHSKN